MMLFIVIISRFKKFLNHFVHIIIKYFSNQFEYVNVLFINKQIGLCNIQLRCNILQSFIIESVLMERETLSYKHFDCFISHFAKTNDHFVLSLSLISQRTIINLFIQLSTLSLKYLSYCVRKYLPHYR